MTQVLPTTPGRKGVRTPTPIPPLAQMMYFDTTFSMHDLHVGPLFVLSCLSPKCRHGKARHGMPLPGGMGAWQRQRGQSAGDALVCCVHVLGCGGWAGLLQGGVSRTSWPAYMRARQSPWPWW